MTLGAVPRSPMPAEVPMSSTRVVMQQLCRPLDCDRLGVCFGGTVSRHILLALEVSGYQGGLRGCKIYHASPSMRPANQSLLPSTCPGDELGRSECRLGLKDGGKRAVRDGQPRRCSLCSSTQDQHNCHHRRHGQLVRRACLPRLLTGSCNRPSRAIVRRDSNVGIVAPLGTTHARLQSRPAQAQEGKS